MGSAASWLSGLIWPSPPQMLVLPLAGEALVHLLSQLCVLCVCKKEKKGKKPTKTETAGEGSQLSNKGIAEATNRLDPQGTLNHLESNHFVLQNTERHWRDGSSRRGLGLDGWRIPADSQDFY